MLLAGVFDTEIINYECELNGAPIVFQEARNQFAFLLVAMPVESCFEELVG